MSGRFSSNIPPSRALVQRERPALAAMRRFDLEQVAKLDHIFAISEFSRDNARRIYGRCGEEFVYPIVHFPQGGRTRSGLNRSPLGILVHSRLEPVKNIDTVIRGFASFNVLHRESHLHIVGEGDTRAFLETLAADTLTPGTYTFHGFLSASELRRVYDQCDVLALLTFDEPFGMVFPEAAAQGLLLVGPDHGGTLEILDGGRLGWCVDAFDPMALGEALERIWALDDAEVDRRRADADRACRARFTEHVVGPQLRRVVAQGRC
jgi:glycosyltransferase involved in cell wall biosynthesis